MEQIATTVTTKSHVKNHQHVFRTTMSIAVVRQLRINENYKRDWEFHLILILSLLYRPE